MSMLGSGSTDDSYVYEDGGSSSGDAQPDPNIIVINFDVNTEPIELLKYLNCFNQVQNLGATYSIKICAQLPIDNNPSKIIKDLSTGMLF